jgi:hypothetical protein
MNIQQAILKVMAAELPEAVVTVHENVIEAELPFFTSYKDRIEQYEVFCELSKQFADDLVVKTSSHMVWDCDNEAAKDRLIYTAEILPLVE